KESIPMKIQHFLLPSLALGGAAFLLLPAQTDAFTLLGGSLGTSQRDVRVFDNFTDASANNNTTADNTNFPGFTGVELAIWKAVTEWGSQLHGGTGNGDPSQVGGLGSGGANFDAVFQGNASAVGGTNDNVHSELAGGDGGVLAFCETPISDGWRIRYYATWGWQDGPGTEGTDIQGIACHEYGHALGLGHTTVGGSTMFASVSGSGVAQRSIATDDTNGVRAVYGVASAGKPRITGVTVVGSTITINGTNFGATNNEVWFTRTPPNTTGEPVKALNVASNGTTISVTFPVNTGAGDVFVKLSSSGHASLSNGFPYNPIFVPPGPPGVAYCFGDGSTFNPCPCTPPDTVPVPSGAPDAGCANSFNLNGGKLDGTGSKNPDLVVLTANGLPTAAFALFFKGDTVDGNGVPSGDGVRCAAGALIRFGAQTAVAGTVTYPNPGLGLTTPLSSVSGITPGSGVIGEYQVNYRNSVPGFCTPGTFNYTNAYEIVWGNNQ
ncbi:MAG: matrixin family metalloprotease, partial [Planctomycetota bacterium]